MKLTTHPDATAFLAAAREPLMAEEAKNNLILGIALRVQAGRQFGDEAPFFVTLNERDKLVAAAIRTPPYNLIVQCDEDRPDALEALADHLLDEGRSLPGAHGVKNIVAAFAELWSEKAGVRAEIEMQQRVYELRTVVPPTGVSGTVRWAEEADVEFLADWFLGFCREAVPHDPPPKPEENVRRFIESGKLAIWEDGKPVSMAGSSRGTSNGATVSAVYTPPEHRGHGYASACVAALSQAMLDEGNAFCTLFADLSNPTSNKIYQNVGFRPVADFTAYAFVDQESG